MAASDKVPLTVTYTATNGGVSTVTVLGQVLNNGATNWVPTGTDNAIVLETSSAEGESSTVLNGVTYYLTTGPALPNQATGVTITPSRSAAGTSSTASGQPASNSAAMTSSSFSQLSPTSLSASSSAASSTSGNAASSIRGRPVEFTGSMGVLVAGLLFSCVLGMAVL